MIRALRKRHFRMMILIALIVPALLAAALLLRRPLAKPDPARETRDNPVRDLAPTVHD
jgi:hypothetical protein